MADEPLQPPRKTSLDWFISQIMNLSVDWTPELDSMLDVWARQYIAVNGGLPEWKDWIQLGQATRDAFYRVISEPQVKP